jgi:hypothetical protein
MKLYIYLSVTTNTPPYVTLQHLSNTISTHARHFAARWSQMLGHLCVHARLCRFVTHGWLWIFISFYNLLVSISCHKTWNRQCHITFTLHSCSDHPMVRYLKNAMAVCAEENRNWFPATATSALNAGNEIRLAKCAAVVGRQFYPISAKLDDYRFSSGLVKLGSRNNNG